MNICLNEINEKRNQILNKSEIQESTINNDKYLDINENNDLISEYQKINKKLDLLDRKLTLIDEKNNLFKKSYVRGFLLLIMIFVIVTAINDYLSNILYKYIC